EYEWDVAKATANRRKHGVSFNAVLDFDWETALVVPDERADYGEPRWLALGMIGKRLHSLAFTIRRERIRVISLRAASRKERTNYEQA
ncbi:MAG: BrnT family toxin, partial [Pseudolabrys sp.]